MLYQLLHVLQEDYQVPIFVNFGDRHEARFLHMRRTDGQ